MTDERVVLKIDIDGDESPGNDPRIQELRDRVQALRDRLNNATGNRGGPAASGGFFGRVSNAFGRAGNALGNFAGRFGGAAGHAGVGAFRGLAAGAARVGAGAAAGAGGAAIAAIGAAAVASAGVTAAFTGLAASAIATTQIFNKLRDVAGPAAEAQAEATRIIALRNLRQEFGSSFARNLQARTEFSVQADRLLARIFEVLEPLSTIAIRFMTDVIAKIDDFVEWLGKKLDAAADPATVQTWLRAILPDGIADQISSLYKLAFDALKKYLKEKQPNADQIRELEDFLNPDKFIPPLGAGIGLPALGAP